MKKSNYEFTHEWVVGVGWMRTSYTPEDFTTVEPLSQNKKEVVFVAQRSILKYVFKGKVK